MKAVLAAALFALPLAAAGWPGTHNRSRPSQAHAATPQSPAPQAGKWYVRTAGSGGPLSLPYFVFQATGDPKQYDFTWYVLAGPFDTQAQAQAWKQSHQ